ncbi:hypothetical protein D6D01_05359 [Aureobasidium pullulans]|uniref:Uncharacterized protein n=1 Tax=Aureobasidium pullulans TaxID=5580 RepID=A0A4S9L854_AURPU|nr:hypothetical protein D6D01_05359 [Aureobasidium pullulans]
MSNFDNTHSVYNTRVKRLGNIVTSSAPFGMWTYPDPVDGPSIAPCYGPYGEAAPPSDILRPWERGTKSGKRVRTRKSKLNQGGGWDAQKHASSDSSTTGSSGSGSNSNASSAATTPTEMSPQNSQATHDSQNDPGLVVAQTYQMCPSKGYKNLRLLTLNRETFAAAATNDHLSRPPRAPTTAQAAIAEQRKRSHDRVESEEVMQSRKSYRRN